MNKSPSPLPTNSLKQRFLDSAEVVDAWRVFPRLYLAVYLYILWDVHSWYKALPSTAYPDAYAALIWGAISVLTGFYLGSGRKWGP